MKVPAISGVIRRRVLLNYRVDPKIVQAVLPARFRPKLIHGQAIAGICLIRLEEVRPRGMPGCMGIASENSAHRIAVEWEDEDGRLCDGVFVPRRDTDSRLNALAGGRIFPGVHHLSSFEVADRDGLVSMRVVATDVRTPLIEFQAKEATVFPETSIFSSLAASSEFFESGCTGYSSRPNSCVLDGLLLKMFDWQVSALAVDYVHSSYYDDRITFPADSIQFDHALLMRDIRHEWHGLDSITTDKMQ